MERDQWRVGKMSFPLILSFILFTPPFFGQEPSPNASVISSYFASPAAGRFDDSIQTRTARLSDALDRAERQMETISDHSPTSWSEILETGRRLQPILEKVYSDSARISDKISGRKIEDLTVRLSLLEGIALTEIYRFSPVDQREKRLLTLAITLFEKGKPFADSTSLPRLVSAREAAQSLLKESETPASAEALFQAGQTQKALDLTVQNLKEKPDDADSLLLLAEILTGQEDEKARKKGLAILLTLESRFPNGSEKWFRVREREIDLFVRLGRKGDAEKMAALLELAYPDFGDSERKARIRGYLSR